MALESGILEERGRLAELEAQCSAIALAAETLKQADAELQSRFSPALGRRAAEYLSRMTAGRYTDVAVSRDFSVLLRRAGENQSSSGKRSPECIPAIFGGTEKAGDPAEAKSLLLKNIQYPPSAD